MKDAQIARKSAWTSIYTRAEQKRRKAERLFRRQRAAEQGGVYFIEAVGLRRIKIGYASDVKSRIASLTTGCPAPLRLVAFVKGPRALEFDLHMKFFKSHSHGEWFKLDKRLAAFIEENRPQAQKKRAAHTQGRHS